MIGSLFAIAIGWLAICVLVSLLLLAGVCLALYITR